MAGANTLLVGGGALSVRIWNQAEKFGDSAARLVLSHRERRNRELEPSAAFVGTRGAIVGH